MTKKIVVSVAVLICAFLQACATNVVYKDKDRQAGVLPVQQGVSVFIDRDGDLYPPLSVTMSGSMFATSRETTGTLRAYFDQASNRTEWGSLLSKLSISNKDSLEKLGLRCNESLYPT